MNPTLSLIYFNFTIEFFTSIAENYAFCENLCLSRNGSVCSSSQLPGEPIIYDDTQLFFVNNFCVFNNTDDDLSYPGHRIMPGFFCRTDLNNYGCVCCSFVVNDNLELDFGHTLWLPVYSFPWAWIVVFFLSFALCFSWIFFFRKLSFNNQCIV